MQEKSWRKNKEKWTARAVIQRLIWTKIFSLNAMERIVTNHTRKPLTPLFWHGNVCASSLTHTIVSIADGAHIGHTPRELLAEKQKGKLNG
ncbi:MAG TPA: hypothetical protein VF556_08610 [Pyrinomonadaceae bacterium]